MLRPDPWYRRLLGEGAFVIGIILVVLFVIFAATQADALQVGLS